MGNKKLKWNAEEEEALRAGVAKYGTGKWKNILDDPQFGRSLIHRSNIDLKDKWRNMTDMPRTQLRGDGPSKKPSDEELDSRYDDVISDAISSSKDAKGSDMNTIFSYIKQRREVPQKFRKLLFGRLKKLVFEGKLEKVDNCYKLKEGFPSDSDLLESYSRYAAYAVAQAENKAFLAAEAVQEAERVSAMAEENEALLQLATEIYEQCSMGNDVVLRE